MSIDSAQTLNPDVLAQLRRHNLLQAFLRAEILSTAVGGVALSEDQRESVWKQFKIQHKLDNPALIDAHLDKIGLSEMDVRWQLELPKRVQLHSQEHFNHKAEARFLARKEQLDEVVYSLLRVQDAYLARELYLRISGNEGNFADLAAQYSQGAEAKTKGIIGPVPMTQAHPALSERLRTSQPGQLLQPFQIDQWWLVVRLERYEAAQFDEKTRQRMAQELFEDWLNQELASKLRALG